MGDPSYVTNLTWNVGDAKIDGVFPRLNITACKPFENKTQAYCDANDKYCASGDSRWVHISYVFKYGTAAKEFVVGKHAAWKTDVASLAGALTEGTPSNVDSAGTLNEALKLQAGTIVHEYVLNDAEE